MQQIAIEDEVKVLRDDLTRLRTDVSEVCRLLKVRTKRSIKDQVGGFVEQVQSSLAQLRERGKNAVDQAESRVEAHPFASLLAAFALGALTGKLLQRRSP